MLQRCRTGEKRNRLTMADNVIGLEQVQVFDFDKDGRPISRIETRRVDERWASLCEAHEQEAARFGAEFWNYGWVQNPPYGICSKTSLGLLNSDIDRNGNATHELTPR
jgi:hypothetical protein